VCGEFASYGFVVVSIEHRDGSGPRTFINLPRGNEKPAEEKVDISDKDRKRGFSRMNYIFPKDNARDTMPGNKQGVDAELRAAQIQLRLAEIEEAYHIMTLIKNGEGEKIASANLRNQQDGAVGGSSRGLRGINWAAWKDRFHLQQVTMLGHSFGGATTVEVLRHKGRFQYIGQGIIYDIWGAAIQPPEEEPGHRIHTPWLGINSEAFMYWPDNFKSIMSLCREAKEQNQIVWLMTVRGSVHISQSDFSVLYPRLSSLLLKMTVNPRRAIDLNVNASLEFLKTVMPARMSQMNRGTNEHLLQVSTLDKLPSLHRPEKRWTAVRLRIPHELRIRLTPHWVRRYTRRKAQRERNLPRDLTGKPLKGLEDLEIGEEVWMHVAPTAEELERWGLEPKRELETNRQTGMVDVTGQEGRRRGDHRGIEQRYMERG
jgi:platelet-activating factor acetylhydrolase